ncbi:hypothetical protein VZT92_022691 [Zoarces viviparus]|uniref:Uncharacterized protein n=1 Tax=Zoarces viviparus TaxID=48416 RepID=A0AAW1EC50_ZOAVI
MSACCEYFENVYMELKIEAEGFTRCKHITVQRKDCRVAGKQRNHLTCSRHDVTMEQCVDLQQQPLRPTAAVAFCQCVSSLGMSPGSRRRFTGTDAPRLNSR